MTRRVVLLTLAVTSLVVIAFLAPLLSLVRDVAANQATIEASGQAQSAAAVVTIGGDALTSTLQLQPTTTVFRFSMTCRWKVRLRGAAGGAVTIALTCDGQLEA